MDRNTLPVQCPNCGNPAEIPLDQLELLHSGMTVDCSECSNAIVFDVLSIDEYLQLHQAQERLTEAVRLITEMRAMSEVGELMDKIAMTEIMKMPGGPKC